MLGSTLADVDTVVAGWRSGEESVLGADNPAGPLYAGGKTTERELAKLGMLVTVVGCTSTAGSICSTVCHCM